MEACKEQPLSYFVTDKISKHEPLRGSACRRLVGGVRRESARSRPGGRRPCEIFNLPS
jgi:hypothetical protein